MIDNMNHESNAVSTPNFNLIVFGEALIDDFPNESVVGGAPFNVARSLAQLGAQPLMLTCIGDDPHGSLIQNEFSRTGLSSLGLQIDQHYPSGRVAVHMEHGADASGKRACERRQSREPHTGEEDAPLAEAVGDAAERHH